MSQPTYPATAGRIVVGVDGTTESKQALRWAAAEARLRSATLAVVHVWGYPYVTLSTDAAGLHDRSVFDDVRRAAQELVSRELFELRDEATGVEIEETVIEGAPAERLLEVAEDADLLVVGSRGHDGFEPLLLGSVSQQCARHAVCPVVIVPSPRSTERRRRQPPQAPWQSRGRTSP
jgi:nucleotide-binding universal stress UspA family protein